MEGAVPVAREGLRPEVVLLKEVVELEAEMRTQLRLTLSIPRVREAEGKRLLLGTNKKYKNQHQRPPVMTLSYTSLTPCRK